MTTPDGPEAALPSMFADPRWKRVAGQSGSVLATYEEIVGAFGQPADRDDTAVRGDRMVRCMWIIEQGGEVVIIYDRKWNDPRWGRPAVPVEEVAAWSVSGSTPAAVAFILGGAGLGFEAVPWS